MTTRHLILLLTGDQLVEMSESGTEGVVWKTECGVATRGHFYDVDYDVW